MRKSLLISAILIFSFLQAFSQEERQPLYFLGGYAAYSHNLHFAEFRSLPNVPCCGPNFEDGSGSGWAAGFLFDYPLKETVFLGFRAGLISHNGLLEKSEMIGNSLNSEIFETTGNNNPAADVYTKSSIDANLLSIGLEPYVSFEFFQHFNSYLGLRAGYFINAAFSQKEEITEPDYVTFKGGSLTRNEKNDAEIPQLKSLQLWGLLGIGYELPIGRHTYLIPEIRYYLPLMDITDVYWKTASLQFGLSLRFPIMPSDKKIIQDTVIKRDTSEIKMAGNSTEKIILLDVQRENIEIEQEDVIIERTIVREKYRREIPEEKMLAVQVDAAGIGADGRKQNNPTVVIEEIETEEQFPLLPMVFFPEGSSDLHETDMRLLTRNEAAIFSEKELSWKTLEIYKDLLNIIGLRMKENPEAGISVTGTNTGTGSEKGELELSKKRAQSVKDYLVETWGISPARIKTESRGIPEMPSASDTEEGIIENARAEIESADYSVLKPVSLKDIRREANPPVVEIYPEVKAEAGIENWSIEVMQGSEKLRSFSGGDKPRTIRWQIEEDPVPLKDTPVSIVLNARDKIGQSGVDEEKLKFEQLTIRKKREEIKDDKRIERFSLILFDFDKAEIKPRHRKVLEEIKERIQPNSQVTIAGYADRIGEKDYNRQLAARRIENTEKILQVPPGRLTKKPIGSDMLLYDNSTPQGRSYSRTVQIIIRTPVE